MFDYSEYIIGQIRNFILNDNELKDLFHILEKTSDNETLQSIRKEYVDSEVFPSIIVKTNQNVGKAYTMNRNEVITDFAVEIGVNSGLITIGEKSYSPPSACNFIMSKLSKFIERTLKLKRLFVIDPKPIDETNTIYFLPTRYRGSHELVNNTIY